MEAIDLIEQELDQEFRAGECLEVEFEDDEPVEDDMGDEEIGVVPEHEIYSDEDLGPEVDDAVVWGPRGQMISYRIILCHIIIMMLYVIL